MKHPKSRAERRHERERVIAKRKYIYQTAWRGWKYQFKEWGRYAKFNLGCGCTLCHSEKYFKYKRKRRNGRKHRAESPAHCRRLDRTVKG